MTDIRKTRLLVVTLLLGLTALRLWLAQSIPLASDETNSWQWSRHLALGYYDQGPMVAWAIRLGTWLAGHTETGVRLMTILFTLGSSVIIYRFCQRIFQDETLGLMLVLAANSTVLFTANGFIHTYDSEQVFFWLLGLYWAARAMFDDAPSAWYAAGLAAGLGMLSKYTSVLLPALLLAFVVFTPGQRRWLKRPQPYLACIIAALVYSPNLFWNATHHWAAFRHTFGMGGGEFNFTLFEFLGGQIGYVGPLVFGMMIIGLVAAWRQARAGDDRQALLLWTSVPILILFLIWSTKSRVYGNWTAPGWPAALLAAGWALRERISISRRWRRWGAAAVITGYAVVMLALFHVPLIRAVGLPGEYDPTMEIYGWPEMGAEINQVLENWPGNEKPFVFGLRYQMASLAAFYTPGQPWTKGLFLPAERLSVYLFWTDPGLYKGRDGLAVVNLRNFKGANPNFDHLFKGAVKLRDLEIVGPAGNIINHIGLYQCFEFQGCDARPMEFLPLITDDGEGPSTKPRT